jgi:hypothetical protein
MRYTATTEDMQKYAGIVASIGRLDAEAERIAQAREQYIAQLKAWEAEHQVPEDEAPAEEPQEPA